MHRSSRFRAMNRRGISAIALVALLALGSSRVAFAGGCEVDQAHTNTPNIISFATNRAQSFLPTRALICGASIRVADTIGTMGDITLELWDRLPNDGGHLLRSGTVFNVEPGDGWISVFWQQARIDPSRHHYLIAKCTDPTMGMSDDIMNGYPRGNLFVGDDYVPFDTWDLSFEIFADYCESDVSQTIRDSGLNFFPGQDPVQSFRPTRASIGGARVQLASEGFITVELWDGFPGTGGSTRLASSTTFQFDLDGWIHVEWKPVRVTPGEEYFLAFYFDPTLPLYGGVGGPNEDRYPDGELYVQGSSTVFFDLRFEILWCNSDCAAGNVNQAAEEVLRVNGQTSPDGAWVSVPFDDGLLAQIAKPSSGGNGKFVLHANWGAPTMETEIVLPGQIGTSCFPMILATAGGTADPAAVWNNLGKYDKVGASEYFDGMALPDPPRAPSFFWVLSSGDATLFPVGTVVTLQGVILDPNTSATKPVSLTNAVVVSFE